ncbi:MAG: tetratricopeptide repeat protein [Candidatus Thiodiazotropha sp.]|jgi:tetratricopeptide (TPR) repeat protein
MKRNLAMRSHLRSVPFLLLLLVFLLLTACSDKIGGKQKYFDKGMELFDQGNYSKARLEFKNVLQIDPKDADAYFMFGQLEEKEGNWSKAYALYFRAVELNPDHIDAQVRLGTIYAMAGKTDNALAAAETALKIDPTHSAAMVLRGFVLARTGKSEAAIDEVQSAIKSDPSNEEAASLLSELYANQGDLDRAIQIAKDSLAQNRERVASYLLLARLYAKADQGEKVISVLKDLIALKPEELQNRIELAAYYKAKGKASEAESVLRQAVKDLPDNDEAKLGLISFLKSNDEKKSAESLLQEYASSSDSYVFKLELAKHYISENRKEEAYKELSDIIDRAGLTEYGLKARTMKASALIKDGSNEEASQMIEEVLGADPKHKDALLVRAGLSLVSDDPDKGIADLRILLREDPSYVKAYRLKARAHLKKGEIELARQSLEEAIKIQPQESAANFELVQLLIKTGKFDDASTVLQKMRQFTPNDLSVLRGLAMVYDKLKKWDELSSIAKVMQSEHKENPLGYYYQGISLQGKGKMSDSITEFSKALKRKPGSIEVLVALAKSYFATKHSDEALKQVKSAVDSDPKHFSAFNLMGEIHLSLKQFKEADAAFNQALSINPKWSVPYRNLVKLRLLEDRKSDAVALLQQGFDKTEDPVLGLELANAKDKMGQTEESIKIYERILDKHPKHLLASNNLVMILLRNEDPDQASLDKALSLVNGFATSKNPIILDTLGWTHLKRGEIDKAISVLRKAVRMDSGLPEIDYHLALAYYKQGDLEAAKNQLSASLSKEKPFEGIEDAKELMKKLPN